MINWGRVNNDGEIIRQVHTTKKMEFFAEEVEKLTKLNPEMSLLTRGAPTWPLAWYFRDIPKFKFVKPKKNTLINYDFIFDEITKKGKYLHLKKDYEFKTFPFRSWWVPDYNKLNFVNFLNYAFTHTPWNKPGIMNILILKKKDLRINF